MNLEQKNSLFEKLMNQYEKHPYFYLIYSDGSWEKIQNAIKNTNLDFNDDLTINSVIKRVVQAINWNCRMIYTLDTRTNSINVFGYEGDDGNVVKDPNFIHPFSKLSGSYPTYNFFD